MGTISSQQPQAIVTDVYVTYAGLIDHGAVQRVTVGFFNAYSKGARHVHLMFQSQGGLIGDGIALYNYFRALPIDLTVYNCGTVASVAAIAYLGAKYRKASEFSTFMIHRSSRAAPFENAARLEAAIASLKLDDERMEKILRAETKLGSEKWEAFKYGDVHLSAQEAVDVGIAQSIGEFKPPPNTPIFTLNA